MPTPPTRRVHFLAYYFPPVGGVASLRNAKLANYLLDNGWRTTAFHAGAGTTFPPDPRLVDTLRPEIERVPVRTYEGAPLIHALESMGLRFLTWRIPYLYALDPQVGWLPGLWRAVTRHIEAHGKPDAVFTSAAPFSVNLVGLALKRRYNLGWVADFQDEWTFNPAMRFLTPLHRAAARKVETATFARADVLTTVTPSLVARFAAERPAGRPVELLSEGYDEADFASPPPPKRRDKWTLAYVGTVYPSVDPLPILDALQAEIAAGAIDAARVRVVHAGRGKLTLPAQPAYEVEARGFVAHDEALRLMREANALLIRRDHAGASSGRIFEYIRSQTAIVAAADPAGEMAKILSETGAAATYPIADVAGLRGELRRQYQSWLAGREPARNLDLAALGRYSREAEAEKLAGLLARVAGS
jgi:glycosyltransferase involved in cell wall biosynthesis